MSEWRPISEAPRDGTAVMLFHDEGPTPQQQHSGMTVGNTSRIMAGEWDDETKAFKVEVGGLLFGGEQLACGIKATLYCCWSHWMPLPPPPETGR